jgi:hypothetical protein
MQTPRAAAVALLLLIAVSPLARADAFYRYDGQPFQSVAGRYTTADSISGTLQLPDVLGPNLSNAAITLLSWSFTDQLKLFTSANSSLETPRVSTDGAGHIVAWSFDFSDAAGQVIGTFDNGPGDRIDQATDFSDVNSLASNMDSPGSWTLLPETSSFAFASVALVVLTLMRQTSRSWRAHEGVEP